MIENVYAMGQTGAGSSGNMSGGFASFLPLIIMFVIFYFLLIRPQQKKSKEHRQMIDNLRIGDRIVINNGIYARIISVSSDTLIVEIADKVKVKIMKNSVSTMLNTNAQPSTEKTNLNEENKK